MGGSDRLGNVVRRRFVSRSPPRHAVSVRAFTCCVGRRGSSFFSLCALVARGGSGGVHPRSPGVSVPYGQGGGGCEPCSLISATSTVPVPAGVVPGCRIPGPALTPERGQMSM